MMPSDAEPGIVYVEMGCNVARGCGWASASRQTGRGHRSGLSFTCQSTLFRLHSAQLGGNTCAIRMIDLFIWETVQLATMSLLRPHTPLLAQNKREDTVYGNTHYALPSPLPSSSLSRSTVASTFSVIKFLTPVISATLIVASATKGTTLQKPSRYALAYDQ
jgi:hypothetical protein